MLAANVASASGRGRSLLVAAVWYVATALLCLWVLAVNGRPLFYFDSPTYFLRGQQILEIVGLHSPAAAESAEGGVAANGAANGAGDVNISRSAGYSLVAALVALAGGKAAVTLLNAAVAVLSVWLPAHVMVRLLRPEWPVHLLVCVPIIVAQLSALPFYVAFLMPDIFAATLLLMMATVAAFGPQMRLWELALAAVLGGGAAVAHLSHLPIAALGVAAVFLVSVVRRHRWWVPTLAAALMLVPPVAERLALRAAVHKVAKGEAVYYPFITARLIEDGPGYAFLKARCPDEAIPSCQLAPMLELSDDPLRLTASNIIFKKTRDLGSFQFLSPDQQRVVAADQVRFFLRVLAWAPGQTIFALARNTAAQTVHNSVEMTIPSDDLMRSIRLGLLEGTEGFVRGRLTRHGGWLPVAETVHGSVYLVSLAALLWFVGVSRRLPGPVRLFAGVVLAGMLANAFVTGAISQPADRYGARVAWLLPVLAVMLTMLAMRPRAQKETADA